MSPEKQLIAIAEACGTLSCPGCGWPRLRCEGHDHAVPCYLNDLNAMQEAEKVLTRDQRLIYNSQLVDPGEILIVDGFFSTAAHRAESFLRTIGKWEDAP